MLEPVGVGWRPRASGILLNRRPIKIELHGTEASGLGNLLGKTRLEVSHLEEVEIGHLVRQHVDLLLLEVSQLGLKESHLLLFNCLRNNLPFFLELEAFVVVLDAPLGSSSFELGLRRGSSLFHR